jgi:hypothetical protein
MSIDNVCCVSGYGEYRALEKKIGSEETSILPGIFDTDVDLVHLLQSLCGLNRRLCHIHNREHSPVVA